MSGPEFKYFANVILDSSPEETSPDDDKSAKSGTKSDASSLQRKSKQIIVTVSITEEEILVVNKQKDPMRAAIKILHGRGCATILSSSSWTCCVCKKVQADEVLGSLPNFFKQDVPGGKIVLYDKIGSYPVCSDPDCQKRVRTEPSTYPYAPSYQLAKTDEDCKIIQHIRDVQWSTKASKCICCGENRHVPSSVEAKVFGKMWLYYCSENCQDRNLQKVETNGYGLDEVREYYECNEPHRRRTSFGTARVAHRRHTREVMDNRDKENWHVHYRHNRRGGYGGAHHDNENVFI